MKISVLMMAYNHEKYIAQAIESVLMQEVDFDYEIIVGDDCSQDTTRNILVQYRAQYPTLFNLLLHEKNLGAKNNQIACMKACTGKYVALLEGDDFWTDPRKLQKQVDFLENNGGYTFCFHRVSILDSGGIMRNPVNDNYLNKLVYVFDDYLNGFYSHTSTIMMINDQAAFAPIYQGMLPAGDSTLQILLAENGNSHYIYELMSCYRVHENGSWARLSEVERLEVGISFKIHLLKYYSKTQHRQVTINSFLETMFYALRIFIGRHRYDLLLTYLYVTFRYCVKYSCFFLLMSKCVKRGGRYFTMPS